MSQYLFWKWLHVWKCEKNTCQVIQYVWMIIRRSQTWFHLIKWMKCRWSFVTLWPILTIFSLLFSLLQMRHPIQMKPADCENRNGKGKVFFFACILFCLPIRLLLLPPVVAVVHLRVLLTCRVCYSSIRHLYISHHPTIQCFICTVSCSFSLFHFAF